MTTYVFALLQLIKMLCNFIYNVIQYSNQFI